MLLGLLVGGCGHTPIANLRLKWTGVEKLPSVNGAVFDALRRVPVAVILADQRPDPSLVGVHQQINAAVRTTDRVAEYCAARVASLLGSAGAQIDPAAAVVLRMQLLDYQVIEGKRFNGFVRIRVGVHGRDGSELWSDLLDGQASRWGRTHNPENFNAALSGALAAAIDKLLGNPAFATAILSADAPPAQAPPPPVQVPPPPAP